MHALTGGARTPHAATVAERRRAALRFSDFRMTVIRPLNARQADVVGGPAARGRARPARGSRHIPGTDAVPYVRARTPGVVNHPPTPVARAKTLLRRTLLRTFSLPPVGAVTQTNDCGTRHSVASATVKVA